MSGIAGSIDEIIKRGFAQLLKAEGFTKAGRNWHRAHGDDWLIVNLQASSSNVGETGKFAINLGVFVAAIAEKAGQRSIGGKPSEPDATIRTRLGTLAYGHDHWWAVQPGSDFDQIGTDITTTMSAVGIPWLETHREPIRVSEALRDSPSLLSFSAALLTGDIQEVERRLKAAIDLRPAAKSHFLQWANRTGIPL